MNAHLCLLFFLVVFHETINALPHYRSRRQINSPQNVDPSNKGRAGYLDNPISGSIQGTYYYGMGADPNYGSFIRPQNSANNGGILPISYNPDSSLFGNLINSNQQQSNYAYNNNNNNNNNAWQRPNANNYYNQPGNRYAPGSQGWYATGGNYWYNNGPSIVAYPYLLVISILILIICT